ncbi:phage tail protein [Streptomyces sp. NBC_01276]|uniref:phage tail protein n=1 Tax=Streptomyces sp. NBC_01276 TaxID=2903808 RepID=UPI00352E4332
MPTGDSLMNSKFAIELGKFHVETLQSVSGLTLGQDGVEGRPQAGKTGEVTVTRGTDKSTAFTDWIKETLVDTDPDAARKNITIALTDTNKQTVRRVHLSNAWASRWEGAQLGVANSASAAEQVTIGYEDATVE